MRVVTAGAVGDVPGSTVPTDRRVVQVMGMPISLALRGESAWSPRADAAWAQAVGVLREADRMFSTYRADSAISRLGRGEIALADCPAAVREVLGRCEAARLRSGGAFDAHLPDPEDPAAPARLDPSGLVKGWAVQRAFAAFEDLPGTDVCLGAGGDLLCRTGAPGSSGWRIGIEDPLHVDRTIAVVPVRNGAVATSGAARRGAHLIDPRTGRIPRDLASVTVLGSDLVRADVEATAAYVMGLEAPRWLAAQPGAAGLLVWADGRTEVFGTAG